VDKVYTVILPTTAEDKGGSRVVFDVRLMIADK
jgi:hypothetical protein